LSDREVLALAIQSEEDVDPERREPGEGDGGPPLPFAVTAGSRNLAGSSVGGDGTVRIACT